ncbi:hypothetical protein F2P79_000456 [Pimephales promelas]|nr:hypothetical protein F2P79_000456 [Pimephales promelas]
MRCLFVPTQLGSQLFINLWDCCSAWYFTLRRKLHLPHNIPTLLLWDCNPAVTVFHSSQACVCVYVLYLVTAMYVHFTFL